MIIIIIIYNLYMYITLVMNILNRHNNYYEYITNICRTVISIIGKYFLCCIKSK